MEGGDSERRRPEGADRKSATGGVGSSLTVGYDRLPCIKMRGFFMFWEKNAN